MLKVFADAGLPVQRHYEDGVMEMTIPLPERDRRHRPGQLPERRGRTGTPRGHRQPAARAGARVGRGHRREPAAGHGGPGDPGQHPHRRVRRPALRGQPARPADQRRALPALGARPARAGRPGRDRGPGRGGPGRRRSNAASAACGPWWSSPPGSTPPPAPTCSRCAAGTACGWSARTASAWPCPPSAWTPRSPPATRSPAWPDWSCSPAAWASPWSTSCPGSASGSPRSPRWATSSTCRATTC